MIRTACIIGAGVFGGDRALVKNRDRNYRPQLRLVREKRKGVEVAYVEDLVTGWREGLNECGLGIVNTALSVVRDEGEAKKVEKKDHRSPDGDIILSALGERTLRGAAAVLVGASGGLTGHTFLGTPEDLVSIELPAGREPRIRYLPSDELAVRTNHGIDYPDAGYQDGPDRASSEARLEAARRALQSVEDSRALPLALMDARTTDREDPKSPVKKTPEMRTSSQMVLDLTARALYLYLLPGEAEYLGLRDLLGGKPKIAVSLFEYDADGTTLYALDPKTGKKAEGLPVARKLYPRGVPEKKASNRRADLAPPLGEPGGPESVVRRILHRIRNPREIETIAEHALDLPNAVARKIYPYDRETGSVFRSFSIMPHAAYRMDLRGIRVEDIRGALDSFADQLVEWKRAGDPRYEEILARTDKIEWMDPGTRLYLVLGMSEGEITIVTAYRKGSRDPGPRELDEALDRHLPRRASLGVDFASELSRLESIAGYLEAVSVSYLGTTGAERTVRASAAVPVVVLSDALRLVARSMREAKRIESAFPADSEDPIARDARAVGARLWNLRADLGSVLSGISRKLLPLGLKTLAEETVALLRERGFVALPRARVTLGEALFEGVPTRAPLGIVTIRVVGDGSTPDRILELSASTIGVPDTFARAEFGSPSVARTATDVVKRIGL